MLDSYTSSPNQVVVTAKKAGISNLLLWDEAGTSRTYLMSVDSDTTQLQQSLDRAFPMEKLHVEGLEGRIVLSGTVAADATADAILKLASQFGKDVSSSILVNSSQARQVRLQVRMVEVDRTKMNNFAFNFFSAGGNNLASTTTNQVPSTLTVQSSRWRGSTVGGKSVLLGNPLNFSLYNSKLNVGATLQDLETLQVLQILAEPDDHRAHRPEGGLPRRRRVSLPGRPGHRQPEPPSASSSAPTASSWSSSPSSTSMAPSSCSVAPEVSALDYTNAVKSAGYTIPALSTRRADTQVVVRSGQTFAISGLLDKRTTDSYAKTPGIASVPILGQLFKSKAVNHSNTELIVIVTPTIIDPLHIEVPAEPTPVIPLLNPPRLRQAASRRRLEEVVAVLTPAPTPSTSKHPKRSPCPPESPTLHPS